MPEDVVPRNEGQPPRPSPEELIELLRSRYQAADQVRRGICLMNAGRYDEAVGALTKAQQLGSTDRKSTRLNSSHIQKSRMPSSA